MSTNVLNVLLLTLAGADWSSEKRRNALDRTFAALETLVNPRNVSLVVLELLSSELWRSAEAFDVVYQVIAAARFLSADVASLRHNVVLRAIRGSNAAAWKKATILAALFNAELRGEDQPPSWLSFTYHYGRAFVAATNVACSDTSVDVSIAAGLLVAMSYCWTRLSLPQQSCIKREVLLCFVKGLYSSNLIFAANSSKTSQHFKDLGVLSRTMSSMIEASSGMDTQAASETLFTVAEKVNCASSDQSVVKPVFLSLTIIQQSILIAAIRGRHQSSRLNKLARTTLNMLFALQHVHVDNSVFEAWRFCFNCSLDILNNDGIDLAAYLDKLLDDSLLSKNPLTTLNNTIYSNRTDEARVEWLLLVIEASSSSVHSSATIQRLYSFCFAELAQEKEQSQQRRELLHSVLLSLHTSHSQICASRVTTYVDFVLAHEDHITERQWLVIFTTLYRLSVSSKLLEEKEDAHGILEHLRCSLQQARKVKTRSRLIKTLVEMLPIIPASYLLRNLRQIDGWIKQAEGRVELEAKFLETCTTTMSSEKAQICSRYLLRRNQGLEERAHL